MKHRLLRRSGAWLRTLLRDRRGEGDLMTSLLLTAAGAVMVGITVPSLFESSDSAARTFRGQVDVLEKGASPSGGGAGGGSGWDISIGPNGVSVSGGNGGIRGSVNIPGSGGGRPSVSVGSSGGGSGGGGTGGFAQPSGGVSLSQGSGSLGGGGTGGGSSTGGGNAAAGGTNAREALGNAIINPNGP